MTRLILALLIALSAATAAVGPPPETAAAISSPPAAVLAPSAYLPMPGELPLGFSERPGSVLRDAGDGLRTEFHQYFRPGAETGLLIGVGAADDEERAWEYHHDLVRRYRDKGFSPAPLEGLADEATILLKRDGELDQTMMIFRVGATVGVIAWFDQPGALTDYEYGRQLGLIAGPMLQRMQQSGPAAGDPRPAGGAPTRSV